MKKHTLLLACAMRILLNLIALPMRGRLRRSDASPRSRAQVATVLAFVISHTTFLAAQDDEMGRCPKVACKSPAIQSS